MKKRGLLGLSKKTLLISSFLIMTVLIVASIAASQIFLAPGDPGVPYHTLSDVSGGFGLTDVDGDNDGYVDYCDTLVSETRPFSYSELELDGSEASINLQQLARRADILESIDQDGDGWPDVGNQRFSPPTTPGDSIDTGVIHSFPLIARGPGSIETVSMDLNFWPDQCNCILSEILTDENNCGTDPATACGNVCDPGDECIAGVCTSPPPTCDPLQYGTRDCNGDGIDECGVDQACDSLCSCVDEVSFCGDSETQAFEECDPEDLLGSPSDFCKSTYGPPYACGSSCTCEELSAVYCGDGIVDTSIDEECELPGGNKDEIIGICDYGSACTDHPVNPGDPPGCRCTIPAPAAASSCGNGILEFGEQCDPSSGASDQCAGDPCGSDCTCQWTTYSGPYCGDGIQQWFLGEQCERPGDVCAWINPDGTTGGCGGAGEVCIPNELCELYDVPPATAGGSGPQPGAVTVNCDAACQCPPLPGAGGIGNPGGGAPRLPVCLLP